jgi:hypothetical protein
MPPPLQKKKHTNHPQMQQPCLQRYRENFVLFAAGFKRTEERGAFLWEKEGIFYGREAALQKAWQKLHCAK